MGVQPATLAPDLVRAEASQDRELLVSRIDEPRTGSSLPPGPVQISGASHDRGERAAFGAMSSARFAAELRFLVHNPHWSGDCHRP